MPRWMQSVMPRWMRQLPTILISTFALRSGILVIRQSAFEGSLKK
jgi:hypothetical protein